MTNSNISNFDFPLKTIYQDEIMSWACHDISQTVYSASLERLLMSQKSRGHKVEHKRFHQRIFQPLSPVCSHTNVSQDEENYSFNQTFNRASITWPRISLRNLPTSQGKFHPRALNDMEMSSNAQKN